MREPAPLVLIGLDAVDGFEVQRLCDTGGLPNLRKLMRRGRFRPLYNEAPGLVGSVWRSFINGLPVGEHGWYFRKIWRPEAGRVEMADPSWLRLKPFWQHLCGGPYRLAIIDVPHAPSAPPDGFRGIYLNGWQCHDFAPPAARPEGLRGDLEIRFGRPRLGSERYGRQTGAGLLELCTEAIEAAEQIGEVAAWLFGRERCDLFLIVLGVGHRAGHYLWDTSQIDESALPPRDRDRLAAALGEVYAACDRAVGRIVGAAPSEARIAVFALHGMGPNPGWTDRFSDILALLHGNRARRRPGVSLRGHIRRAVRSPIAIHAARLLPCALHRRLGRLWSAQMFDWKQTRFFDLPTEVGGHVRINLSGREPEGIVRQGAEFDALCEELIEALSSLEDLATGEPIVAAVDRIDHMVAPDAPFRRVLPDLAVRWADGRPLGDSIGVRSRRCGELVWERGQKLVSGRSGNHRPEGWLLTARPGIAPGAAPASSALDLVRRSSMPWAPCHRRRSQNGHFSRCSASPLACGWRHL